MWSILAKIGGKLIGAFTGGTLDKILETIDKRMDSDVEKDRIKAEVTKTYVNAQANLLVGRTWWFQLFFVIPLGFWWTAVVADSVFGFEHDIAALPSPLDDWAALIISALFVVDGTKAVIGRFKN